MVPSVEWAYNLLYKQGQFESQRKSYCKLCKNNRHKQGYLRHKKGMVTLPRKHYMLYAPTDTHQPSSPTRITLTLCSAQTGPFVVLWTCWVSMLSSQDFGTCSSLALECSSSDKCRSHPFLSVGLCSKFPTLGRPSLTILWITAIPFLFPTSCAPYPPHPAEFFFYFIYHYLSY